MKKYIILLLSLFLMQANAEIKEGYKPTENIPDNLQLYFEPEVSIEVEKFAKDVAGQVGFTSLLTVVHPSKQAQETSAAYKVIIFLPNEKILSINKEWFDSLNEKEKFSGIGLQLINQVPCLKSIELKNKIENIEKYLSITGAIKSFLMLRGIYFVLNSKIKSFEHIYLEALAQKHNSAEMTPTFPWIYKMHISMIEALIVELIIDTPIYYIINKWKTNKAKEISMSNLESWVRKHDCLESSISYITKSLKLLGENSSNQTLKFLLTLMRIEGKYESI